MIAPVATYRLQLRNGVDLDAAAAMLPALRATGISHLYLSPVFAAAPGSTHGYDVTDPTVIDPMLGGRPAFDRLAEAAAARGIGLILDIVPNHMAFSTDTPWLREVLRHGKGSPTAPIFDIDWSAGPLVLPFLPAPFEAMLAEGRIATGCDEDGPVLVADELRLPLRPDRPGTANGAEDLRALHDAQHWQLVPWMHERDGITHRRFFNVTGLIGLRVEDEAVFDRVHRGVMELVLSGAVAGLRIDHIDGLRDPAAYLRRLRDRVGDTPVWVEKILTGDEVLPPWPVAGTTGYEAARRIAMALTDGAGHARLVAAWREATGHEGSFHDALVEAKHEVMQQEMAAELHQLIGLAGSAIEETDRLAPGAETLREAVLALLVAFPRYRTYFSDTETPEADVALMHGVADAAAEELRSRAMVDRLRDMIVAAGTGAEAAFRDRFQQVAGALLAKAHEDTAGFRWTAYLAANEVGADPEAAVGTAYGLETWAQARPHTALTLTSSHDTKRSEDARMRLVAMSQLPDAFLDLWTQADQPDGVSANRRWYLVQSALAIWDADDPDLADRLADHAVKAMREAKRTTNWTHPDEAAEAAARGFVIDLVARWRATPPPALAELIARGEALSLAQLALKALLPGVPDFYQGSFGPDFALTDPDNRRPVPPPALARMAQAPGFAGRKARLTRVLLDLRGRKAAFFERAETHVSEEGALLTLQRRTEAHTLTLRIARDGRAVPPGTLWPEAHDDDPRAAALSLDWR